MTMGEFCNKLKEYMIIMEMIKEIYDQIMVYPIVGKVEGCYPKDFNGGEQMNNSRWKMNRIGLLDFWYYDDQEFYFLDGRMLLRGSNGSGKSVTMQSFIPLLLDGNMRPERLDPFGSRARKMENYLLEDGDGREERTGYLYMEFKRKDVENYLT